MSKRITPLALVALAASLISKTKLIGANKEIAPNGNANQMVQSGLESDFGAVPSWDATDAVTFQMHAPVVKDALAGLESFAASTVIAAKLYVDRAASAKDYSPLERMTNISEVSRRKGAVKLNAGQVQVAGLESSAISLTAGLENFSNIEVDTFTAYSAAYNIAASKQSEFADIFFKPIMQDPLSASFDLEVNVISTFDNVVAPLGAKPYSKNIKSLIKQISDGTSLVKEDLRLYPIARTENAAQLNFDLKRDVTVAGGVVEEAAPIKAGIKIGLLSACVTTALAATGTQDSSDSLSRDIEVEKIYISVTNGTDAEYIGLPLNVNNSNKFVRQAVGEELDMGINTEFEFARSIKDLKTLVATLVPTNILATLNDNYTIVFNTRLSGLINIGTGNGYLSPVVELARIYDNLGADVTSAVITAVTDIKAIFGAITVDSYDLKCFRLDDNLRQKGMRVTRTSYYVSYPIGYNQPIQIDSPAIEYPGRAGDSGLIEAVNISGIQMDQTAIRSLLDFADMLSSVVNTSVVLPDEQLYKILGPAAWYVRPSMKTKDVAVKEVTSNVSSKDFVEDVSSSICSEIRQMIVDLVAESKINDALKIQLGNDTVGVSIGIPTRLSAFVDRELIKLPESKYDIKIAAVDNDMMDDTIIIGISKKNDGGDKPSVLDRGFMVYYPDVAGKASIYENGATKNIFICRPGFQHINNMPILGKIVITGLTTATKDIMARVRRYNAAGEVVAS